MSALRRAAAGLLLGAVLLLAVAPARASEPAPSAPEAGKPADGTSGDDTEATQPETDFSEPPTRKILKDWNEYDLKLFTFRWGIYTLLDWGTGFQDLDSVEQVGKFEDTLKIRDFRFTFKGRFATKRDITYTAGLMYDGPSNSWFPRETGIQVAIPELWGSVFVGRQKTGVSLNKVSVGYAVWMMERMPMNDAAVPILSDGIKWLGVHPSGRANWNVAYFHNTLPKVPAKGQYDDEIVARFAFLPLIPDKDGALLHLAASYHWGKFTNGMTRLKSRPESFNAPLFLDTGTFPAVENHMVGLEAYFQKSGWLIGSEYIFDQIQSSKSGNPLMHGGEAFVAWLLTGETHPYENVGGRLGFVVPNHSVFDGGTGALEPVLHLSYTDFDDGAVHGGRFWRLTPHLNWYLDPTLRLEFDYGLGMLDKDGRRGFTNFFQARLMVMVQ